MTLPLLCGPQSLFTHTLSHSLSLITQTQHLCTAPRGAGLGFDTTNNKQQQPICHLPSSLHWLSHHRRSRRSKEKGASANMASKLTAFWNHPAGPKTSEPLFFLSPSLFFCTPWLLVTNQMSFLWSLQLNWVLSAVLASKRVSKFLVVLFCFRCFFAFVFLETLT